MAISFESRDDKVASGMGMPCLYRREQINARRARAGGHRSRDRPNPTFLHDCPYTFIPLNVSVSVAFTDRAAFKVKITKTTTGATATATAAAVNGSAT